ncbi:hypothetical protein QAD02_000388 [Eretmocerus hayati]|uniref:Uncharacterized protein n=1 Tax=Eretmocerus hayati TaxID=131215 RepID=A0ACC2ND64_9HYME|nr:hypothetical protein QAD02_000388 [Eretmocerus hayati]
MISLQVFFTLLREQSEQRLNISYDSCVSDLAVTVGNEIDFISRDGSQINKISISDAINLVAMAYDDDSYTMFLSDAKNRDFSILSVDMMAKNITAKPLLKRDKDSQKVHSMAFDSSSRWLFWSSDRAIMKMKIPLNATEPSHPELLHRLETQSPRGIALDLCNRHIYWANSNRSSPSIMRSSLDGSQLTLVVSENLYEPLSVAVDHVESRLYWVDDEEGIHYKLESSNLDGSGRATVYEGTNQQPVHLAADRDKLYWNELVSSAIWSVSKMPKNNEAPRRFKSYLDPDAEVVPTCILARDNLGGAGLDCKAMKSKASKRADEVVPNIVRPAGGTQLPSGDNATISENGTAGQRPVDCLNGGVLVDKAKRFCRCKPGFTGARCEVSACHNYCLRGECSVNVSGAPVCKCGESFTGQRCEQDLCNGYCLNGGLCSVLDGNPTCDCKYSSGARCESTIDMAEVCTLYCMNRQLQITSIDPNTCRCSELNQTIEEVLGFDAFNCTILVPALSGLVGMLTIVVIALSIYASRLRRRPRIKKRFVVNKGGITPLTSRPGSQLPSDQCEITIENCCNMNICETPCFEPKLRGPMSNGRSGGGGISKKEERNGLLDHMEGNGLSNTC